MPRATSRVQALYMGAMRAILRIPGIVRKAVNCERRMPPTQLQEGWRTACHRLNRSIFLVVLVHPLWMSLPPIHHPHLFPDRPVRRRGANHSCRRFGRCVTSPMYPLKQCKAMETHLRPHRAKITVPWDTPTAVVRPAPLTASRTLSSDVSVVATQARAETEDHQGLT